VLPPSRASETSVDNYFARHYIPEDKSELHTRRRENLKSNTENNLITVLFNYAAQIFIEFVEKP
jgi:hypothetical protein